MNMPQSFGTAMGFSLAETLSVASLPSLSQNASSSLRASEGGVVYLAPAADANKCWPIRPTLRNELDTFSVHFYVFFGPNISIPPDRAAVFAINLMPVLDSGGVLNMELKLNMVSCSDSAVPACFKGVLRFLLLL
ncbi:Transmembrane protein 8B [Liparis tanakae]|uniref:Transmembrane protein 8B n=1 Tax=Liparis tanakae TaxID=230148 RepID=A0A4Z2E1W0_9TELE|nr:Transmembrane protein 8B [Liparis tanakae]